MRENVTCFVLDICCIRPVLDETIFTWDLSKKRVTKY